MRTDRGATWPRVAAAVVAVVAVVGVMVAASSLSGSDEDDSASDPASQTPPPPPECPEAPAEGEADPIDEIDPDAPDSVPEGATSVRLCQGPGTELADAGTLLTEEVQRVVTTINDLDQQSEKPEMCTMDVGPGFRMVFGYADGSTFTVSGKTYGCRELVVGSAYRIPANDPLQVFRDVAG